MVDNLLSVSLSLLYCVIPLGKPMTNAQGPVYMEKRSLTYPLPKLPWVSQLKQHFPAKFARNHLLEKQKVGSATRMTCVVSSPLQGMVTLLAGTTQSREDKQNMQKHCCHWERKMVSKLKSSSSDYIFLQNCLGALLLWSQSLTVWRIIIAFVGSMQLISVLTK